MINERLHLVCEYTTALVTLLVGRLVDVTISIMGSLRWAVHADLLPLGVARLELDVPVPRLGGARDLERPRTVNDQPVTDGGPRSSRWSRCECRWALPCRVQPQISQGHDL